MSTMTLCSVVDAATHQRCIAPAGPHERHVMAYRELDSVRKLERRARDAKLVRTFARVNAGGAELP